MSIWRSLKLSEHFTLAELTASDTARRFGLDNTPTPAIVRVLRETAANMETVRAILCEEAGRDIPVHINSCYRAPAVNKAVGSGPKSSHIDGRAVDCTAPAFGTPLKVARAIEKARRAGRIDYDQLIHEFGGWVHIGFDPRMRGQSLTIYSEGGKPRTVAGLQAIRGK